MQGVQPDFNIYLTPILDMEMLIRFLFIYLFSVQKTDCSLDLLVVDVTSQSLYSTNTLALVACLLIQ